jgi:hypothetical protein
METKYNKYPNSYKGMNSQELAKDFKSYTEDYKRECLIALIKEYKSQSINDKKKERIQLSSGLENLSTALYATSKFMKISESENSSESSKLNTFYFAKRFGKTSYFYQKEFFNLIKEDMPKIFDSVLKSIDNVCCACKPHMKDSFNEQYY